MSRRFVDQLRDGDNLEDVYLVTDKQLRANRNGNPYLLLELRDRTGGIQGRMWNAGDHVARGFDPGDFLYAVGKVQLFQGALQVILTSVERVEAQKVEFADFLPQTEQSIPKLTERLRNYLLRLSNPHLRALAECFLMDDAFMRAFTTCPAGVKLHHAYVGGLLEHTISMMDAADKVLPLYPVVDRDLVLMGIFLHDAGKTRELTFSRAFGYSDEGQLVGHIPIAVAMLAETATKVPDLTGEPFPRELMLRIQHMILSHHGELAYGSPKVPMTPEAMLLHLIDLMDTRMHMVLRDLKDDRNNPTAWTPYNHNLGRRIYKGGALGDLYGEGGGGYD
ncbi:HD domain-containing protein [Gemmata sp. G18]|uniref:HD domain-containing protein n=1 Tax=Gemmata palustris TaxID=2822762 RepID=A0ABS5BZ17_9BACT|nr:OB-fold nucleic acid binding domain-containing protein [Gemmata palustris]MBP3958939.1 HD domain-containing protein [Gemmata palustris]